MPTPLPSTDDPIILGYDLTDLVPQTMRVEKWLNDSDAAALFPALRVVRRYLCRADLAESLAYPFQSPHPAPYTDCLLKRVVFEDGEVGEVFVDLVFENPYAASTGFDVGIGQTAIELDVGVEQLAVERHPRFKDHLTEQEIAAAIAGAAAVREFGSSISSSSDFGSTPFTITIDADHEVEIDGVDDPTAEEGGQLELFLELVRGRETVDWTTVYFRKTTGRSSDSFTAVINGVNKLNYPGYSLPGTALNWKRGESSVTRRGPVRQESIFWAYADDPGWDQRYYRLL